MNKRARSPGDERLKEAKGTWGSEKEDKAVPVGPIEQPSFVLSGALSKDVNTGNAISGVVLKWVQPPEARVPDGKTKWRLYVFKGESTEPIETLHLHRQSAFLFGRDAAVADIKLEHSSISKQHAVIQFRLVEMPREPGDMGPAKRVVRPYLLDLDATNGTFLNGVRVEGARYIELKEKDVLKFGGSSREFVLVLETST